MKRTIYLLLAIAACRSASPTPPTQEPAPTTTTGVSLPGAAQPRQAVERFLRGVESGNLQEIGLAWGTVKGPAADQMERAELDKRLLIFQSCYENDKYRIIDEVPGSEGRRVLRVELTKGNLTRTPRFTTIKGPSERWYVEDADFSAVTALCKR